MAGLKKINAQEQRFSSQDIEFQKANIRFLTDNYNAERSALLGLIRWRKF